MAAHWSMWIYFQVTDNLEPFHRIGGRDADVTGEINRHSGVSQGDVATVR